MTNKLFIYGDEINANAKKVSLVNTPRIQRNTTVAYSKREI